ncbi:MAG: hypothetical protein AB7O98_12600 [Hyphomonadaceae bacterium]
MPYELSTALEPDIARHEVSEDGVHWRPFDPVRDRNRTLHRRIEFAPIEDEQAAGLGD